MEAHPYAKLFPMLGDEELKTLAADIKANGQRQNIIVDTSRRIIDGRNRDAACELAGVEPKCELFDGDDAAILKLVISLNLHRRHLNESQRSMIAASVSNMTVGAPKGNRNASETNGPIGPIDSGSVSVGQAAELLNVGERSVKRARKVQKDGVQELNDAVVAGEISVKKAEEIASLDKSEQPAAVEAVKNHKPLPPREPKQTGPVFDMNTAKADALKAIRGVFRSWPQSARQNIPTFLRQIAKESW